MNIINITIFYNLVVFLIFFENKNFNFYYQLHVRIFSLNFDNVSIL